MRVEDQALVLQKLHEAWELVTNTRMPEDGIRMSV